VFRNERLEARKAGKRHRRTTEELRAEVLDLPQRGVVATAIADVLNLVG
jgi:hypothetical protein